MRLFLYCWLLLLLPLQSAWSVAAQFCQHESNSTVQHFGHHQHLAHASDQLESITLDGKKIPVDHGDHLHHSDLGALSNAPQLNMVMLEQWAMPLPHAPPLYQSPLLARPDHPSWLPLVIGGVALT